MPNVKVKKAIDEHRKRSTQYNNRFTHKTELKREMVDRDIAIGYINDNFNRNRPVSKAKVKEYVSKIKQNEFNFNAVTLAFCVLPDGRKILVNGQHCSFAIMDSDIEVELDAKYHYVNDMEDVKNYYTTYDIGRTRNMSDRISAIGLHDEIAFKRSRDSGVVANALKMIIKDFRNQGAHNINAQTPAIITELSAEYKDAINRSLAIRDRCELDMIKRFISKPAIFGVMILTMDIEDHHKAEKFWTRIVENDMGMKGDPVHALIKTILDGKFMKQQVYESSSYNVVARIWNCYVSNKKVHNMVVPPSEPIKLFLN